MLIQEYVSLPVKIKAVQFTPATRDGIIAWCGARHRSVDEDGAEYELENIRIKTLEGEMMARPGDYIVCGTTGEFYPCKSEIFEAKYKATGFIENAPTL